jgi:uncharacterized protein YkwD
MRAVVVLAGTTLLVSAVLLVATATAAAPSKPRSLSSADALASRVLRALNDLRSENGLGPLRLNGALTAAAESHSAEMLEAGYFGHESADGTPYWKRVARFYRPGRNRTRWTVGENLFWAAPNVSAGQAIRRWMHSPHHRINLLTAGWHDVGIAAVRATRVSGAFRGLSVTVLTVDFGVR